MGDSVFAQGSCTAGREGGRPYIVAWIAAFSMASILLLQSGCVVIARPVAPDPDLELGGGRGLLLLDIDSNIEPGVIDIGGAKLEVSGTGHQYLFFDLPEGRYAWKELEIPLNERMQIVWRIHQVGDSDRRAFSVRAGAISYPGQLFLEKVDGDWMNVLFRNRSSIAMNYVRNEAPDLLASRRFIYTGYQRDDFPQIYQRALRTSASPATEATEPSP